MRAPEQGSRRVNEQPSKIVLAVVNLKGGTGKTTSAAFLAHALHETGWRVLGVDADPQRSMLDWSAESPAGWPFTVVGLATRMLARDLEGVTGDHNAMVIDTPPLEEQQGIVRAALQAATHVVIPVAPTPIEYRRLAAVQEALDDSVATRRSGAPPESAVLLTRTVSGASSTNVWREAIEEDGMRVLKVPVTRLERYSQSFGDNIQHASDSAYGDAIWEMFG